MNTSLYFIGRGFMVLIALQAIKVFPPAVGTLIQICGTRATLFLYGSMAVPAIGNNGVLGCFAQKF